MTQIGNWIDCDECHGQGQRVHNPTGRATFNYLRPCPDCVDGLVPPDAMVEAAAKAMYRKHRLQVDNPWDQAPQAVRVEWCLIARSALVWVASNADARARKRNKL